MKRVKSGEVYCPQNENENSNVDVRWIDQELTYVKEKLKRMEDAMEFQFCELVTVKEKLSRTEDDLKVVQEKLCVEERDLKRVLIKLRLEKECHLKTYADLQERSRLEKDCHTSSHDAHDDLDDKLGHANLLLSQTKEQLQQALQRNVGLAEVIAEWEESFELSHSQHQVEFSLSLTPAR